ncbi:class II fructose-bisphosphate aldolase [Anaerofilum sp. BX8]|uniref:Class II fructose-bisphosphate aldolase n=1 Tax=Anaerofilum hominis TaxID=2763016 RepID=A0A923I5H4_9FIRM|nr:class II fructose-bisphosphate aldolase [Anaerofilum hominis]MBC5580690.1 class II fructose-bisphosphate aldolase [Anaerofilum hominis]
MALVTSKQMLLSAKKGNYAVGAFNAENMEMVQAIIAAAEEMHAPVIIQTTPSTVRYGGLELYLSNVKALAEKAGVPVALHLDHGSSFELCAQALRAGYTSIMIDGSQLPLEENIALTRRVVEMCAPAGVPVEGEIGRVGGKEDDTQSEESGYTIPSEAVRFEAETGLSSMAVGVGTAHGVYKTTPVLNTQLVAELAALLSVPLVLHGASGLSDSAVRECIRQGICKVNFATELRIAYSAGIKKVLSDRPDTFDPKVYGGLGRENVKNLVKDRITVCGCSGRA